jgi:uncharacterized protein DUF1566
LERPLRSKCKGAIFYQLLTEKIERVMVVIGQCGYLYINTKKEEKEMSNKGQKTMLALAIVTVFAAVGLLAAGPVGAKAENPCAALQAVADRLGCELGCGAPAPVEKTGQTTGYEAGDDGNLTMGVVWPDPRFTDNLDGTVTDNLTGLIWLKNANRFGQKSWSDALNDCNTLAADGTNLADGSVAGDWRLPNVKELQSLIHYGVCWPALPNTAGTGKWTEGDPFSGVESHAYWSSSTYANNTDTAWLVTLHYGNVNFDFKDNYHYYVWPVRGGE